ncbi:hypothetical protein JQ609_21415 [Bradyrhizobium sp. AUGA SZCCT0169]|uniref:hypothetical protein n=1 Tax=Bradyrhizobium sp. AUGA SZCCT0169 TaxID=2807663 RepID=UPI001BAA65F4|nr:hypothetical protein [Bradyrhizobium sp. AUGA SZCCT0169]MBR1249476.1 hypothetical protein [Bradyrhizobium sp. AUGA SZCCT0169]
MKIQNIPLWVFFGLMIMFILAFTIGYTLDIHSHTKAVRLITLWRAALLIVGATYLWTVRQDLPNLVDAISITVGCMLLVGAFSGLFNHSDWRSYLVHGFQYASLLVSYLIGRDLARRDIPKMAFTAIFITILAGYTIAMMLYAATPGLHSGSYSFQPNLALLPLAHNGNPISTIASAVLIIVGNKRAVFIGACFCTAALAVLFIAKRRGGFSFPVQTISIFVLTPMIAAATISILSTVQIPLMGMVGTRLSSSPSFINTDTKSRMADSGSKMAEATVDPLVRLTGARNVEIEAIWQLLSSKPNEFLIGAGFGSKFEMDYVSPNNYDRVRYTREQADVMPAHIAMTSGLPLAILFTGILVVVFCRMFSRLGELQHMDRTFSLFSISLLIDILLGFNPTNALVWSSIGYATMRSLDSGTITSK